jgi:hypothetical protein
MDSKKVFAALTVVLLLFLGACSDGVVKTMNPKTRQLFDAATDFDLCNGVCLRIGDQYGHMIAADKYRPEERVVMLVWHGSGIIDNGGFEYLFEDDFPGDPGFRLTAQAFEQIDCEQAAAAFREAMAIFPDSRVPPDIDVRVKLYKQASESRREAINMKFWQADWEEAGEQRLRHKVAEYIRRHKAAFAHL